MALGTPYNIGSTASAAGVSTTVVHVGTDANSDSTTVPSTGDSVFVLIGIGSGATTITSVTDAKSNTYTLSGKVTPANNEAAYVYECLNPGTHLASADAVTVTWGASTSATSNVRVIGCSGVASSSADDQSGTGSGTSTGPTVTAAGSLAQASELAVAVVQGGAATGGISSWGGSFTQMGHNLHSGSGSYFGVATLNTNATTAPSATATNATSGNWGALLLTFKASTAGAGGLSIVNSSPLPGGQVGVAYTDQLTATGGISPYTWDISSGAVQAGLTLSSGLSGSSGGDVTYVGLNAGPQNSPTVAQLNTVNSSFGPVGCTKFFFSSGGSGIYTGLLGGDTNGGGSSGWSASGGSAGYTPAAITAAIPGIFILVNWGAMMSAAAIKNFILSIPTTVAEVGFCFQSEPEHAYATSAGAQFVSDWTDQANKIIACRSLTPVKLTLMTAHYLAFYASSTNSSFIPPPSVVDVCGLDFYDRAGQNVGPDMGTTPAWVNWTSLVKNLGKPLGIPEYGLSGYANAAAQNTRLQADWKYIQGAFGSGGTLSPYPLYMWNFWNVNGTSTAAGTTWGQLQSAAAQQQWAAIEATAGQQTTTNNGTGGVISGTPTVASTVTPTFRVTDSASTAATKVLSLTISAAGALAENDTDPLAGGTINVSYSAVLNASGGTAPYTFSVNSGSMPTGLSISGNAITGTPTAGGTSAFVIKVTDNVAATALSPTLHITISTTGVSVTTVSVPAGQLGSAYTDTLTATGGTSPYTWAVATGPLPAGLTLDPTTGIISGTPTVPGSFPVSFTVTDAAQATATSAVMNFAIATSAGLPAIGRQVYGGAAADFVFLTSGSNIQIDPGATITFWNAKTGGSQYTDLQDMSNNPITSVTTDSLGFPPQFQGPAGLTAGMWADAHGGSGPRYLIRPDLGALLVIHQTYLKTLTG